MSKDLHTRSNNLSPKQKRNKLVINKKHLKSLTGKFKVNPFTVSKNAASVELSNCEFEWNLAKSLDKSSSEPVLPSMISQKETPLQPGGASLGSVQQQITSMELDEKPEEKGEISPQKDEVDIIRLANKFMAFPEALQPVSRQDSM